MTQVIDLLYLAPMAGAAFGVSGLVWAALRLGQRWMDRLAPAAQARVVLASILAPAFLSTVFLLGVLGDWLVAGPAAFCVDLHGAQRPSVLLGLAGILLGSRLVVCGVQSAVTLWHTRCLRHTVERTAAPQMHGAAVLPGAAPHAFVVGLLTPRVYLSHGLLATLRPEELAPVLAHEQAHVCRRDPLVRWIAGFGLSWHLPGIAAALQRQLRRTHELAADADAAQAVGDRLRVAEALVRYARLQRAPAGTPVEFGQSDLAIRVQALLGPVPAHAGPSAAHLFGVSAALVLLGLGAAHSLHHIAQRLLSLP